MAVKYAVEGKTDYMVAFERAEGLEYKCNIKLINLTEVANTEKKIPREWINEEGNGLNSRLYQLCSPVNPRRNLPSIRRWTSKIHKFEEGTCHKINHHTGFQLH